MSPNAENSQDEKGSTRHRSLTMVVGGGVLLILYVVSPIPMWWTLTKFRLFENIGPVLNVVYAPLTWLYNHVDVVHEFYDWQERLFGR